MPIDGVNSRRATGPKSAEGKARSSQNGLYCAFLSSSLLIPGENPKALAKLREKVREHFRPVGPVERILVERAVNILWRLGRLHRVESELWSSGLEDEDTKDPSDVGQAQTNYHPLQDVFEQDDEAVPF